MEFEKFVENVKETIKDYLPMEYENAIVDLYPHEKLNESYLGMTVRNENQNISPTINLNMFYEQLQRGRFNLDQIMEQMAEVVQMTPMSVHMGLLTDYDFAKIICLSEYRMQIEIRKCCLTFRIQEWKIWRLLIMC